MTPHELDSTFREKSDDSGVFKNPATKVVADYGFALKFIEDVNTANGRNRLLKSFRMSLAFCFIDCVKKHDYAEDVTIPEGKNIFDSLKSMNLKIYI